MNVTQEKSLVKPLLAPLENNPPRGLSRLTHVTKTTACQAVWWTVAALLLANSTWLPVSVATSVLLVLSALACLFDWSTMQIPNKITYPAIMIGLALNVVASAISCFADASSPTWFGAVGLVDSVLGLLCGFAAMVIVFALTGKGGGDVKLAAAIGSLLGPSAMLSVLLNAHLLAGMFVATWIVYVLGPINVLRQLGRALAFCFRPDWCLAPDWQTERVLARPVPMAGFFALATLFTLKGI